MKTKNNAIILDLGGVILYPPRGEWHIPANFREILGERADEFYTDRFRAADKKLGHLIERATMGGTEMEEYEDNVTYFLALSEEMGWNLSRADAEAMSYHVTYTTERHAYYPDTLEYLGKWRQEYVLCCLSDTFPSIYHYMDETGLAPYFDHATYSMEVGCLKPDPRMYRAALEKLDIPPEACVFVDDKLENLWGARDAGIRCIRMKRDSYTISPINDAEGEWDGPVARDLAEVDRIVKEIFA